MDSTIFNRRTLLGGGALAGIGALLAACGQQANSEAAATASAAPSESASASAAASDAASASATPSPVITRGYSGGSKDLTANTVKLMNTVWLRTSLSPRLSRNSTLKPLLVCVR